MGKVDKGEYPEYDVSKGATCGLGMPVSCGAVIRLMRLSTMKNLHSHHVESPLSHQQEITGFGNDGKGDAGDNWRVVCSRSASYWERDMKVRLEHVDTGMYLGTPKKTEFNQNTCGRDCPIMGHLESFGRSTADANSYMKV